MKNEQIDIKFEYILGVPVPVLYNPNPEYIESSVINELEKIVDKHRDLDAYLTIATEAYNLGVQKSIENCDKNYEWNREELEKLKV